MKTAKNTRSKHLKNDLQALITWIVADVKAAALHHELERKGWDTNPEYDKASREQIEAQKAWYAIPRKRRLRAQNLLDIARKNAETAFKLGGVYSGKTTEEIIWEGPSSASTIRRSGDSYSRNKWQYRTDANHKIHLDVEGLLAMEHHVELLEQSAEEGLPVIALYRLKRRPNVYQAVWAQKDAGKAIASVDGWIAHEPARSLMFHSTISASDASKGLIAKMEARLEERSHQDALREASPKHERRARLITKLCGNIHANIEDARKLGYCDPGIKAFRRLHGIGKTVSLPELVGSGNPLAVKLALYIARRISVAKRHKVTENDSI